MKYEWNPTELMDLTPFLTRGNLPYQSANPRSKNMVQKYIERTEPTIAEKSPVDGNRTGLSSAASDYVEYSADNSAFEFQSGKKSDKPVKYRQGSDFEYDFSNQSMNNGARPNKLSDNKSELGQSCNDQKNNVELLDEILEKHKRDVDKKKLKDCLNKTELLQHENYDSIDTILTDVENKSRVVTMQSYEENSAKDETLSKDKDFQSNLYITETQEGIQNSYVEKVSTEVPLVESRPTKNDKPKFMKISDSADTLGSQQKAIDETEYSHSNDTGNNFESTLTKHENDDNKSSRVLDLKCISIGSGKLQLNVVEAFDSWPIQIPGVPTIKKGYTTKESIARVDIEHALTTTESKKIAVENQEIIYTNEKSETIEEGKTKTEKATDNQIMEPVDSIQEAIRYEELQTWLDQEEEKDNCHESKSNLQVQTKMTKLIPPDKSKKEDLTPFNTTQSPLALLIGELVNSKECILQKNQYVSRTMSENQERFAKISSPVTSGLFDSLELTSILKSPTSRPHSKTDIGSPSSVKPDLCEVSSDIDESFDNLKIEDNSTAELNSGFSFGTKDSDDIFQIKSPEMSCERCEDEEENTKTQKKNIFNERNYCRKNGIIERKREQDDSPDLNHSAFGFNSPHLLELNKKSEYPLSEAASQSETEQKLEKQTTDMGDAKDKLVYNHENFREIKYARNDCEESANSGQEKRADLQINSSESSCEKSERNLDPTLSVTKNDYSSHFSTKRENKALNFMTADTDEAVGDSAGSPALFEVCAHSLFCIRANTDSSNLLLGGKVITENINNDKNSKTKTETTGSTFSLSKKEKSSLARMEKETSINEIQDVSHKIFRSAKSSPPNIETFDLISKLENKTRKEGGSVKKRDGIKSKSEAKSRGKKKKSSSRKTGTKGSK